jgi:hypothetical protein
LRAFCLLLFPFHSLSLSPFFAFLSIHFRFLSSPSFTHFLPCPTLYCLLSAHCFYSLSIRLMLSFCLLLFSWHPLPLSLMVISCPLLTRLLRSSSVALFIYLFVFIPAFLPSHSPLSCSPLFVLFQITSIFIASHTLERLADGRQIQGYHLGSKALLARVKQLSCLRLNVFGHVHASTGRFGVVW